MRVMIAIAVSLAGCGRVNFDPICGLTGPCVTGMTINRGDVYARGPRLSVSMRVTGDAPPFEVRIAQGDCVYADDGWQPYGGTDALLSIIVEPTDGTKRVCAWARDANGDVSANEVVQSFNVDTIIYEAEHVPIVEAFDVIALDATQLRVTWRVSDREGLAANPIELDYTTDGKTWLPLAVELTDAAGTLDLAAPAPQPFVVRAVPRDRAGNRGFAATSSVFGAPGWQVYAGAADRGIGGAALTARFEFSDNVVHQVAIDPATHDTYAVDAELAVVRIDGATGEVERLISNGPLNLPDDGPLPADAQLPRYASLRFGPDAKLYVGPGQLNFDTRTSSAIYQIDPVTRHCRRYLGGGTRNDATATPATVFAWNWIFSFDEDGSLYFLTSCAPGTTSPPARMLKATRNPDGTAGTISVVAGNCATGMPPAGGPSDPLAVPLGYDLVAIGSIAAWDHGRVIYYGAYSGRVYKIVDGLLYSSNITPKSAGSIAYDAARDRIYAGDGEIRAYTPNLAGVDDTLIETTVAATGSGDCARDGIAAADACVHVEMSLQVAHGRLYFLDGPGLNEHRAYRVRFVAADGAVHSIAGSMFHGAGLDRHAARGRFSGIHYKQASAPNQATFPAGLYFLDWLDGVFGHIDEADAVSILWGNQSGVPRAAVAGGAIGADVSLGIAYTSGNVQPLGFDANGLPWLRYGPAKNVAQYVRIDSARQTVELQTGTTTRWFEVADGTDPRNVHLWPYGGLNNLSIKDAGVFVLGSYTSSDPLLSIRLLDFGAARLTHVMGTTAYGYTADRLTPGTVAGATLPSFCNDNSYRCFTQYRADEDRLYFSEGTRVRFITAPSDPASATLQTLWTDPLGRDILNFSFRPDGSQVFFTTLEGTLRCHDLSSGAAWCNDTDLGPPVVLGPIGRGPDQLTWRDDRTLLISTYYGQVLQYTPP